MLIAELDLFFFCDEFYEFLKYSVVSEDDSEYQYGNKISTPATLAHSTLIANCSGINKARTIQSLPHWLSRYTHISSLFGDSSKTLIFYQSTDNEFMICTTIYGNLQEIIAARINDYTLSYFANQSFNILVHNSESRMSEAPQLRKMDVK